MQKEKTELNGRVKASQILERAIWAAIGAAAVGAIMHFSGYGLRAIAEEALSNKFSTKVEVKELVLSNDNTHQQLNNRLTVTEAALIKYIEERKLLVAERDQQILLLRSAQAEMKTTLAIAAQQAQLNSAKLTRIEDKLDRIIENHTKGTQ